MYDAIINLNTLRKNEKKKTLSFLGQGEVFFYKLKLNHTFRVSSKQSNRITSMV